MLRAKYTFYTVTEVNSALVSLKLGKRHIDLLKADFPWNVKVGDRVCMKEGFIHSKVPDTIGKAYMASLIG